MRSPPERSLTRFCWSAPLKLNHETYWREFTSRRAELDRVVAAGDLLPDGARRVEVGARLVDVGELDRVADAERAGVRLLLAGDHAEERRLAGAVRADHADDPAGRQREGQVLEEQPVAEALGHAVGLDHEVAEPRAGRDVDLDAVELLRALLGEQPLVGRRGAPSTSRAARVGLIRTHSSSRASVRRRADSCLLLAREPRLLLLEPRRVVALERDAAAAVELEDPARRRCRGSSGRA